MNIYGIKDSANFTLKYKSGENKGKVYLYADYANVVTNEWTSEQVYAKSKGVNAIRWDYGRASTLKVDMEIFDLKWMAMLFGSEFVSGSKDILKREVLTVSEAKATMVGTPITGSLAVYEVDDDGVSNISELIVTTESTVASGSYKIAAKELTFNTEMNGKKVALFYLENKSGVKTLTINADKFPVNFEAYGDTLIRGTDGEDEFVQIHYLNLKAKSNFTFTLDASNVTTVSAEFDVLKDTESSDMAEYSIYDK